MGFSLSALLKVELNIPLLPWARLKALASVDASFERRQAISMNTPTFGDSPVRALPGARSPVSTGPHS